MKLYEEPMDGLTLINPSFCEYFLGDYQIAALAPRINKIIVTSPFPRIEESGNGRLYIYPVDILKRMHDGAKKDETI